MKAKWETLQQIPLHQNSQKYDCISRVIAEVSVTIKGLKDAGVSFHVTLPSWPLKKLESILTLALSILYYYVCPGLAKMFI